MKKYDMSIHETGVFLFKTNNKDLQITIKWLKSKKRVYKGSLPLEINLLKDDYRIYAKGKNFYITIEQNDRRIALINDAE